MSHIQLDVYLFFTDNKCKEAMEFYQSIFGGELTMQRYDEMPGMKQPENSKDKIMHASLSGGDIKLMASDSTREGQFGESSISISLTGTDEIKLRAIFDKLADGGKVTMPLDTPPWGGLFGDVIDKYGVDWMISINTTESKA